MACLALLVPAIISPGRALFRAIVLAGLGGWSALAGCGKEGGPELHEVQAKTQIRSPEVDSAPVSNDQERRPLPLPLFTMDENEEQALGNAHSISAWSATIERYRLLESRGESGNVHGLLVDEAGTLRLVDQSIGGGALSIPIEVSGKLRASLGATPTLRVVLRGAWVRSEDRAWLWHATEISRLPAREKRFAFLPALLPIERTMPKETVAASLVPPRGGLISFVVKSRSKHVADGWLIADSPTSKPVARLLLPGERASYGDQSRLTERERWKLARKKHYWLRIRRLRKTQEGELPVYRARTAPYYDAAALPLQVPEPRKPLDLSSGQ